MKLAFALVPDLATHVEPHHSLRMSILLDGQEIQETRGSDFYHYHALILPGSPLAGTGRDAVHRLQPDLSGLHGVAATAVELPGGTQGPLSVLLDSNLILSQEILQSFYSLRCDRDAQSILFPLKSHLCRVAWEGLGVFHIDAQPILAAFPADA